MTPPRFDAIYVAPDVADRCDPCLAYPPHFDHDGDALLVYFQGDHGLSPAGHVRAVYRAGPLAVVDVESVESVRLAVLVRAESVPDLPPSQQTQLAAELRTQYGESLTVRQLATAGVVTRTAVHQALRRGRLAGQRTAGRWTFTPEQAAAWLVARGIA